MNRVIWKYEIKLTQEPQNIVTKKGAILRYVGTLNHELYLWVEVDENELEEENRMVLVIGTGWQIPSGVAHLGTSIIEPYVWHIYGDLGDWGNQNG